MSYTRRTLLVGLTYVLVATAAGGTARGARILYFVDKVLGADRMQEAINQRVSQGDTVIPLVGTTLNDRVGDFKLKIESGLADLGIFFLQNENPNSLSNVLPALQALSNFAQVGGASIYTEASRSNFLAALFEASWGDSSDLTQIVVGSSLDRGIDEAILLNANIGWGSFSNQVLESTGSGSKILADFQDDSGAIISGAIVSGNKGRSLTNGFQNDVFIAATQGVQLYLNQISLLLDPQQVVVPEPGSWVVFAMGGASMLLAAIRVPRGSRRRRGGLAV